MMCEDVLGDSNYVITVTNITYCNINFKMRFQIVIASIAMIQAQ